MNRGGSWRFALALVAALVTTAQAQEAASAPRRGGGPHDPSGYRHRTELLAFAADVATRRGWDRAWVLRQLAPARKVPAVQRLIMPPPAGTAKNWAAYRAIFVEPRRIAAGVDFWLAHEAALKRAEAEYGVPPEIVAGIVGVETFYGRITGGFRVLDALATLAFDFPAGRSDRSAYFRSELEELLALVKKERIAASTLKGSYAGAIGLPQFMPGSINRFAVDFDGNGHVDLRGSAVDAIGSVAAYLASHGWQRGMATHFEVSIPSDAGDLAHLLGPDIVPSFTAAQFAERGARLDAAGATHDGPMALVELQNGDAPPSHVTGTRNFYAITRYNQSSYYALAVAELARALHGAVREKKQAGVHNRAP